jgi:hypothetical protein
LFLDKRTAVGLEIKYIKYTRQGAINLDWDIEKLTEHFPITVNKSIDNIEKIYKYLLIAGSMSSLEELADKKKIAPVSLVGALTKVKNGEGCRVNKARTLAVWRTSYRTAKSDDGVLLVQILT